jgi:hypothetical protein
MAGKTNSDEIIPRTRPLRNTAKRAKMIQQIKDICNEKGVLIEVDLRCYHYVELGLAFIKLQLAKGRLNSESRQEPTEKE